MRAALVSEYRKFVTTRMWWVLLITMALYMAFLGAVMAFPFTLDPGHGGMSSEGMPPMSPLNIALTIYTLAPTLGYVFPLVIGAMSVTGEFRHMTVTPTFLAEPRRTVVLGAKLIASLPIGLFYGLVGTLSTVGAGAAVLSLLGHDAMLTDPEVQRTIALSVLALTVWAMVGVGFGTVLPNQVAAIVVVLAFTQLVEPVLRLALGAIGGLEGIAKWLPGAAGEAIAGTSFYSASGIGGDLLTRWQGLVVLVGYGVVLAAIGRFTTFRRDIT